MDRAIPPAHPPEELPRVLLWRWRRNPLRRRTDLAQAWITLALFLTVPAATPAAVILVGDPPQQSQQRLSLRLRQTIEALREHRIRHLMTRLRQPLANSE
ncbi:hypothetical protein GCM10023084_62730 [Streptomyces lacrimifluminis]|uniref:Uncharacterized protein n=1 Tax=Streptomyces lacrimifluminis TaxID=1500077 RepID=A0A917NYZ9_9ACTN|nr:hypothetical protein GCM10012282_43780 [Streptomyces lacrimifluminis]